MGTSAATAGAAGPSRDYGQDGAADRLSWSTLLHGRNDHTTLQDLTNALVCLCMNDVSLVSSVALTTAVNSCRTVALSILSLPLFAIKKLYPLFF